MAISGSREAQQVALMLVCKVVFTLSAGCLRLACANEAHSGNDSSHSDAL